MQRILVKYWSTTHNNNGTGKSPWESMSATRTVLTREFDHRLRSFDVSGAIMRFALLLIPAVQVCLSGCGQQSHSAISGRQQVVERCSSLVSQNRFEEGAACFEPFERDAQPDRQTAAAAYRLGQLYESGRGVPTDPDHAVRLYKLAAGLGTVAPEIAQQASIAATKLINRMRQAEEP
jgi:TPR repeat protein